MNKELIYSIVMPNYPRKIKVSESRRAKYYKIGDNIPKYLQSNLLNGAVEYRERKKDKPLELFDTVTKEFIIKNSRVAGTQNWKVINGNGVFSKSINHFTLGKIFVMLKGTLENNYKNGYYSSFLEGLAPINKFPLFVECEVHDLKIDPISSKTNRKWDIYNRGLIYCKAFDDSLTEHKLIPDDNIDYIICPSHPIFVEIQEWEIPKLVFKIYHIC